MFTYFVGWLLEWIRMLVRRPETARVPLQVTPIEAIIAARRNARR